MFVQRIVALCAAGALLLPFAAATAQDQDNGSITVTAPRVGKWSPDGTATETVAHSIRVNISDLDLRTPAGLSTAEARIRQAAKRSCDWLDANYPAVDSAKDCERNSVDAAMTRARAIGQQP
ncbi:UrcA family protein [Sphingomonas sp. R-74633]|uniref:UrcA family protein n=1 Tax=Sphingomonas sp. R-74633 TaxID=2751188 RepID=UPI0015D46969|nr:UrcA family protein [Sphingomonas sp. R-74633]NYT42249.1 UrcA family protein [Sphingomonas sp. R-74633]